MARKVSVYLSDRALALPRVNDSLSGRLNDVADRYTEILLHEGRTIRERFLPHQWPWLVDALRDWQPGSAAAIIGSLEREVERRANAPDAPPDLLPRSLVEVAIGELRPVDLILLFELLEADRGQAPPRS
jgi:hypothetical protein